MKNNTHWYSVTALLEVIALECGIYTYAALHHHERLHVLLLTGILCLLGGIVGTIVTRSRAQAISYGVITCGIVALGTGIYLLNILDYHERAILALATGIICIIGGLAGIIVARSRLATLSGVAGLGIIALGAGIYFLTVQKHQSVAYLDLGTGAFCLLGGLAGIVTTRSKARTTRM